MINQLKSMTLEELEQEKKLQLLKTDELTQMRINLIEAEIIRRMDKKLKKNE